jgi:hypothetical protein
LWRAALDPRVVAVDALAAPDGHDDALDVSRLSLRVTVVHDGEGRERLLLTDGSRSIRLDVRSGTLLAGPVRLRYLIEGFADLGHKLMTLRRLVALRRLGRLPASLFPGEQRAARWILILRVADALVAGASHRDIAVGLFGQARVGDDWRGQSDFLRLRVQRLARTASRLVDGGYLELLRDQPPL